MKKILLTICLAAVSLTTFAQTEKPVTFGVFGSFNLAIIAASSSGSNQTETTGSLPSVSAGFFADIKIAPKWSIQPGLMYAGKGGKTRDKESNSTYTTNLNYLEIPVNVVYHSPVKSGEIWLGAGPYFAYGLSAKETLKEGTNSISVDIDFGSAQDEYKPTDAGITFMAAYKLNSGLFFALHPDIGLQNIVNINSLQYNTRVTRFTIGYSF